MVVLESGDDVVDALRSVGYIADETTATCLLLALKLEKPLLVEGPSGVGKTALATAWASVLERDLIRLQCYDGLDEPRALYEWSYGKQLLATQLLRDAMPASHGEAGGLASAMERLDQAGGIDLFFSERFLVQRPILRALRSPAPALLLVDEIDRAGEEVEALLLEALGDRQVTVPELGSLPAIHPLSVVLTSNATRDLSDALRRRCLHVALDYPTAAREREILEIAVPGADPLLRDGVVAAMVKLRTLDLRKRPSAGEAIDWLRALDALGAHRLDQRTIEATAGVVTKYAEDRDVLIRVLSA